MRGSVEAVIAEANPSPSSEVAVAAIQLARRRSAPADACRLAALDDSATEISGQGETVDDGETVRGFTLYMGPMPPPPRTAAPATVTPVSLPEGAQAPEAAPAAAPSKRHRHGARHHPAASVASPS
jgi:hypothetical protein